MNQEELLEREAIKDVRLAYSAHYDGKDLDALMEIFTEDAVLHFSEQFGGDWVGRETIRRNFSGYFKETGGAFDAIHVVTNPWIEIVAPDRAKGRWYLLDYLTQQFEGSSLKTLGGHGDPLFMLGVYEDRYRKEGGRWKLARSRLSSLWPVRDYPGPLED